MLNKNIDSLYLLLKAYHNKSTTYKEKRILLEQVWVLKKIVENTSDEEISCKDNILSLYNELDLEVFPRFKSFI